MCGAVNIKDTHMALEDDQMNFDDFIDTLDVPPDDGAVGDDGTGDGAIDDETGGSDDAGLIDGGDDIVNDDGSIIGGGDDGLIGDDGFSDGYEGDGTLVDESDWTDWEEFIGGEDGGVYEEWDLGGDDMDMAEDPGSSGDGEFIDDGAILIDFVDVIFCWEPVIDGEWTKDLPPGEDIARLPAEWLGDPPVGVDEEVVDAPLDGEIIVVDEFGPAVCGVADFLA
jgi:hypothetical protein